MKYFNITGTCVPDRHFMADTSDKISQIIKMIERGNYFVINRPRQYGKTTTLSLLENELLKTEDYLPIRLSFEGIGDAPFKDTEAFGPNFLTYLGDDQNVIKNGYSQLFYDEIEKANNFDTLSKSLTKIISKIDKKIVLMIDEVDKSSDNNVFIYFLGMLRDKYLKAVESRDITFHSVILAGLHDVKSLKMKIYATYPSNIPPQEGLTDGARFNSPWNIASEFEVDMSLSINEIASMLSDYSNTKGYLMDISAVSERIHFWTSGYPFLTSKLCKIIDEKYISKRENKNWEIIDIDLAAKALCSETNTLFENISKNLENKQDVSALIESVILGRDIHSFNLLVPVVNFAYMYGMIRGNGDRKIRIHNKIFEEVITEYYVEKSLLDNTFLTSKIQEPFLKKNGRLDLELVLLKFQETVREKYSSEDIWKSDEFLEKDLRMLFLMFLKPIINGIGFSFKEVQTGAEKRLDIVIVFKDEKFVVELKLWRGDKAHSQGIKQLKQYMKAESVNKGYMLIMSKNKEKDFVSIKQNGIFCVFV